MLVRELSECPVVDPQETFGPRQSVGSRRPLG
jgi:hypothetical protein